jgi:hypothetical protein
MTREELTKMVKGNLIALARYYNIEGASSAWTKDELVDEIWSTISKDDTVSNEPRSARVKRLREQNRS